HLARQGAAMTWTTRIAPELTRSYGVEELHNVAFEPRGWPGHGTTISLSIPECELQYVFLAANGDPVAMINRPQNNKSQKHWLRYACRVATEERAYLFLSCDTAEQAEQAAKAAGRRLPHHHRAALERLYEPNTRARERLS